MKQTDIIAISLDAASWQQVMAILADGPYKLSAPLIHSIQQQCMQFESAQQNTGIQAPQGPRAVSDEAA
jgi:hypothetical protein